MTPRSRTASSVSTARGRASAITEAELRLEDAVEVALPERDEPGRCGRRREHSTMSPSAELAELVPSTDSVAGRCADHLEADSRPGSSTSERSNSMCGDTGVSSRARWRGDTIGPRAESEYAVEPVGVATMSPSAA